MAAAYITIADVYAVASPALIDGLFVDDDGSDTYRTRAIEQASAMVQAYAHGAGYLGLGDTTTDEVVKTATVGQFLLLAFSRRQQTLPDEYFETVNILNGIREGSVVLPTLTRTTDAAVGGVSASPLTGTNRRDNPFSREKLDGY